jgi:hypothetical protein
MSAGRESDPRGTNLEARIDRITLHVTDMDPIDARRLAEAVALALAPTLALAPGEGAIDRLDVRVQAKRREHPEQIAAQVAQRLAPLLARVTRAQDAR